MRVTEERRKVEQIPEYDEDGRIIYYKIPNYTKTCEFLTLSERKFYRTLIKVIKRMNDEQQGKYIQISTQVAINRVVKINDERKKQFLIDEIQDKSIDYILFDLNSGEIIYCIELNGKEHYEDEKIIQKDKLKAKVLRDAGLKLTAIKVQNEYDENEIYRKLKE